MTGFADEAEAIGAANDPPLPKTDPSPDPDEIADLVRTFYDDAKFRALFRMKKEVSPEAFDAMATLILNLKGNKE